MTEGWKTTEFWLVIALFGLVVANTPLELGLDAKELLSMAIAVAGYSGARGIAKFTPSQTTMVGPQESVTVSTPRGTTTVDRPEPRL
jgi:hypothetical protein